jgi:uncharacterized protein
MSSLQLSDKKDKPVSLAGALVSGLVFGLGLLLAGMTNPAKVLGFLDIAGAWDPSLALVMVSGIAVARIGLLAVRRRGATLTGSPLHMPHERPVEHRLLIGSALFGLGWGLAGFCPGPAVAAIGFDYLPAFPVVAGMLAGLWMRPLPRIH